MHAKAITTEYFHKLIKIPIIVIDFSMWLHPSQNTLHDA